MRLQIILITSLVFSSLQCLTQTGEIYFKHFGVDNGLSNNWIRCIYQDEQGFIWVGTSDGLNRFDAYSFKTYRPQTANNLYLSDVNINAILKKDNKELWVCTDIGVYVYNYIKDKLIPLPLIGGVAVLSVLEEDSSIWFGSSNGLFKYNKLSKSLTEYRNDEKNNKSLSNNYVNVLFKDNESNIWVGTNSGLNQYKRITDDFERVNPSNKKSFTPDYYVLSICEDLKKQIYIGTAKDGLFQLKQDMGGNYSFIQIHKGYILAMLIDQQNNLWFSGSSGEGLGCLNLDRVTVNVNDFTFYNHENNNASISDNSISCIFEDKNNDIWIGTLNGGINFFSKRNKKFQSINLESTGIQISNNRVNAILEEEKYLWIGTEAGLDRYNKAKGTTTHFYYKKDNPNSLGGNSVFAIIKDSKGKLWIGAWDGGISSYNYFTELFIRHEPDGKLGSISNENVFSICEDNGNYLWVATLGGGACRYDYKTGLFKTFRHSDNDAGSLYTNSVNCIFKTSDNRFLFSTYNSVDEFNYQTETFTHTIYSHDSLGNDLKRHIISIFEDSKKHIWLATNTGIEILNRKYEPLVRYSTANGLPDNVIQAMLEDSRGNLWISTTKGLSKLINGIELPANPVFENFVQSDGLSGNEFIKRSAFKNSKGTMYFGTSEGLTFFNPDSISLNIAAPEIVLTEFQYLSSQSDENIKKLPLPENINATKELELSYRSSDFIIRFAALNYLNTEKNRYQYMLKGYNIDWIDAEQRRSATYTNIQPGRYTFMVKGSNNDGVWSKSVKMLSIYIRPPWWKTIGFKVSFGISCALVLLLFYRLRLSSLKYQKKVLEATVEARTRDLSEMNLILEERQEEIIVQNNELADHRNNLEQLVDERTKELITAREKAEESDRLKSAFLANMSHEIRTPMNAIVGFSDLLNEENLDEQEKRFFIQNINNNSETLLVLINDIIDISIIEANQLVLTKSYFNVNPILSELEKYYRLKSTPGLTISFVAHDIIDKLVLFNDQIRFRQIVTNLLNNAVKYSERGVIKYGYFILPDSVQFYVSDTGIGISPDDISKIFKHFHKVEMRDDKIYRGAGIGLAICKKLVEMMGGTIWVESTLNVGSVFYFTLPIDNKHQVLPNNTELRKINTSCDFKGLKIIVVEDDETNFDLMNYIIRKTGADVTWLRHGKESVDFFINNSNITNCIVFMDIKMPVMDGFEACTKIKAINKNIPVVAVTAYASAQDHEKISQSGFDEYLAKPLKANTIIELIGKYAEKYSL